MNIRDITKNIKWHEDASESTKSRTVRRIQTMADAIEAQFPAVRYCNQIKLKHMIQLLKVPVPLLSDQSPFTSKMDLPCADQTDGLS